MALGQVDYFDYFDLPRTLELDVKALKKSYYRKSLELHPDHNDVEEEDESAANNQAYKKLQNWDKRIQYVLEQISPIGLKEGDPLDPMFLMEMMDWNEDVEAATLDSYGELQVKFDKRIDENRMLLQGLEGKDFDNWTDPEWELLKRYYLQGRYLLRLKKNLDKFADPTK